MRFVDDVLVVIGAALLVRGVSLVSVPGAYIVAGLLVIAAGVIIGIFKKAEK